MEFRLPWIILRTVIFTILAPGSVTVLIPYWLLESGSQPDWDIGVLRLVGLVPIATGAVGYFWCAWDFAATGRGTPFPLDAPRVFVARGLYRYVRNPMYLSVLSVALGEGIVFESQRLLVYAFLVWMIFHLVVVLYEEPTLRHKFGPGYDAYRQRVPRWIPK